MTSLIQILLSFFQWLFDSVDSVITFCQSAIDWLYSMHVVLNSVVNVVCPPALQGILGLMISFMIVFLVVRLVVNLL